MSLILEALKKLERDKQAPDRGFVVMAPVTWPSAVTPRVAVALPLMLVTAAAGAGAYLALTRAAERSALPPAPIVIAAPPAAAEVPRPAPPVAAPRPRAGARAAAAAASAAPEEPLELQAISQRDGKPVAVLNGRVVGEGDGFDQVRVIRIGASEVEVEVRGKRRLLQF
jgi:MSHA biogenesis protein MshK